MKTYAVSWGGKSSFGGEEIEAEDERTAYKIFLWKHRQAALSMNKKITVGWGNGNCVHFFKEDHAAVLGKLEQSEMEKALQAPQRERERKQRETEVEGERKAAASFAIMEKLKANGFHSLIPSELALLMETVESALQRPNELHEWEMELVQTSLLDDVRSHIKLCFHFIRCWNLGTLGHADAKGARSLSLRLRELPVGGITDREGSKGLRDGSSIETDDAPNLQIRQNAGLHPIRDGPSGHTINVCQLALR